MASSSKPKRIYDVFLSFRGEDVRNNFLGHLYKALDQKGIYTYVDSEELRKGEQIAPELMMAIEESHIAIIVFSEDYASSCWCLEEVAKIMDCKEERDLMVFPLFYKVDPKEVRTPREKYRKAMLKHESKFGKDSEEIKRWKKALFDAGSLSGWHLKDGDESELIQGIVTEISTHLDRTPLHVAKHPVGIDSQVVKLKSILNLESNDGVLMVGFWGQGGIGKTTLAKALYNAISGIFKGSCFLANVREASKDGKGLVSLQEKLLYEILSLQQTLVVSSVDRGINLIRERLRCKKVLLILDDVDHLRQLNALAGEGKWFGDGSRIIITTRDKHLLTCSDIDQVHVYEVKPMAYSEARELLSKYAFSTHKILKIKTDLVDGVLDHAKGLPLALEVLGSFLRGRREDEWESTLYKISTAPNNDINDVLKISYEGLQSNEKEIFLDIACFFKGWETEYVKKVLEGCDLKVVIGLQILIERSLIRIESRCLQMHDLIQLMGMDIVNQECDDPGKRSRLWLCDDLLDVLSYNMGDCIVKAIVLEPPEPTEIYIGPHDFTKMRRLRLLILHNVHNSFQVPIFLSNELRWCRWDGCATFPEFSSGKKKLLGLDMNNCSMPVVPNYLKVSIYLH
ncbi:TMV resistance protein N-like [Syzygium oleosum]|uniref:TMV resistance protein N-like n=1 Tax=Syzygium oleosum TaxID=219896 RepID=UPI0024BAEF68|nr:TMV resistance protein N-like [Syzygium oleosum]